MKKKQTTSISNPSELNKHLQNTSPSTWIILFLVAFLLIGFFVWASIYELQIKIMGVAQITSGEVTLNVKQADLNKLKEGQKVYIADKEGTILSFNDKQPVVSHFELSDGEYTYKVIIGEKKPIEYLINR